MSSRQSEKTSTTVRDRESTSKMASNINAKGPSPIPFFYRAVFTSVDPLFCLLGLYTHLFDPVATTIGYSSTSITESIPIGTRHMLDNLAAFFAMLFVLEGILLRVRSHDPAVWRLIQTGGVLLDAFMTFGAVRQLSAENRLTDFANYTGNDWHHVFGNAGMGLLRLACAANIGIESGKAKRS